MGGGSVEALIDGELPACLRIEVEGVIVGGQHTDPVIPLRVSRVGKKEIGGVGQPIRALW